MSNGQQIAAHNVALFTAWAAGKSDSDFRNMIHRGALSRSVIAQECGFAKSALAQNPRIKSLLTELESGLRAKGVLPPVSEVPAPSSSESLPSENPSVDDQSGESPPAVVQLSPNRNEAIAATNGLEAKLQRLQAENACQRAEIEELRKQLKQFTSIHEALSKSGRMPR